MVAGFAEGDGVACLEGADDDGVVGSVLGEGGVGGEGGGDPEVDTAGGGFLPKEVGFHLHVAVAEQEDVGAAAKLGKGNEVAGLFDGPVGPGALVAGAPVAVEQFGGVAAVQRGELLGEGGAFFFGG